MWKGTGSISTLSFPASCHKSVPIFSFLVSWTNPVNLICYIKLNFKGKNSLHSLKVKTINIILYFQITLDHTIYHASLRMQRLIAVHLCQCISCNIRKALWIRTKLLYNYIKLYYKYITETAKNLLLSNLCFFWRHLSEYYSYSWSWLW